MRIFLETGRLALRQFIEDDTDNLFELNSDPDVMRYLTGGEPTPREEIRDKIIPFHLSSYERHPGFGTWAARSASSLQRPVIRPRASRSLAGRLPGRLPGGVRTQTATFLGAGAGAATATPKVSMTLPDRHET